MVNRVLSWLRSVFGRAERRVTASGGGVAIGRDSSGPIYTGPVHLLQQEPEEDADEGLWPSCVEAATAVVQSASVRGLLDEEVVPVQLVETRHRDETGDGANKSGEPDNSIDLDQINDLIAAGRHIVLLGEGGIGKSTIAVKFAQALLEDQPPRRLPILVDASAWAASGREPFEYVAMLPGYVAAKLTAARLSRFAKQGRLTLFIDGWNEIAADLREPCAQRMRAFVAAAAGVSIVLSTRNTIQRPEVPSPVLIRVAGLDWQHQKAYIQARLPAAEAESLVDQLAVQAPLRQAARNPLVLQGFVSLKRRKQAAINAFMAFKAIVESYEDESGRRAALDAIPLLGLHHAYLEALAWGLNTAGGATLPIADARSVVAAEAEALRARAQISMQSEPSQILEELCDHHLLDRQAGLVKFAHQRFQEYFAATRYLALLVDRDPAGEQDRLEPIDSPVWQDTLLLVAAKFSGEPAPSASRATLVRTATTIDLHFACVLAAAAGFERLDDAESFDALVSNVGRLADAPAPCTRDYGLACIIDSALPAFAEQVWNQLEQEDQQQRLRFHRLGTRPLSLRQLGPDAPAKLSAWSAERHAELLHEVAGNPANWDYLMELAGNSANGDLRVAAIAALRWEYPVSDMALKAWLHAPDSVKLHDKLIETLEEDFLDAGEDVHAELRRLHATLSGARAHFFALQAQPILPPPPAEFLLDLLEAGKYVRESNVVDLLARDHAAELDALAIKIAFSNSRLPAWAADRIRQLSSRERAGLFDRGLRALRDDLHASLSQEIIASCADLAQVRALLREYLDLSLESLASSQDSDVHDRLYMLRSLLLLVDGDILVNAAVDQAHTRDAQARLDIAELIRGRVDDSAGSPMRKAWRPTADQTDALIHALLDDDPSGRLLCRLADIASRADVERYGDMIRRCCERELHDWADYRVAIDRWVEARGVGPRPMNPQNGFLVSRILARWGFGALPFLRSLTDHAEAERFVFSALASILQQPWQRELGAGATGNFTGAPMTRQRRAVARVMLQPSQELQAETDAVAAQLGDQLASELTRLADRSLPERDRKRMLSRTAALTAALAKVPSPRAVPPVIDAILIGNLPDSTAMDAVVSLQSQGLPLEDRGVVLKLCAIWEDMAARPWLDDSARWTFKELSHAILRVPHSRLPKSPEHYLDRWMAIDGGYDASARLASSASCEEFELLRSMLKRALDNSHRHENIAHSIVSALSTETWPQFAELIDSGTFFGARVKGWALNNIAKSIYDRIGKVPGAIPEILSACTRNNSHESVTLGCALLVEAHASDKDALAFAERIFTADNEALDANAPLAFRPMFSREEALDRGWIRMHPVSSNSLRRFFLAIANSGSRFASAAGALLCKIEADRRKLGRPVDEPRNPDRRLGRSLAHVLTAGVRVDFL